MKYLSFSLPGPSRIQKLLWNIFMFVEIQLFVEVQYEYVLFVVDHD